MGSLEERIVALEKRINILEMMVGIPFEVETQQINKAQQKSPDPVSVIIHQDQQDQQPSSTQPIQIDTLSKVQYIGAQPQQQGHAKPKQASSKLNEAAFGKYIVGALASILVFVAAISLIALVWDTMSSEAKLSLIILSGIVLTVVGFARVKNHKNPITSILLGTGSGLLFISILAANMAFDLISSNAAFVLAGLWALFFILSYKFTQTFFTTIIAYIGSFIATLLGLTLIRGNSDFIVIVVFTVCIGIAMLVSGYRWLEDSKQFMCTLLILVSMLSILIWGISEHKNLISNWGYYFVVLVLLIHGLLNRILNFMDDLRTQISHIIIGSFVALITLLGLLELSDQMAYSIMLVMFLILILAQLLFIEWRDYHITTSLTSLYTVFLIVALMLLNSELFDFICGISVIALVLMWLDKVKGTSRFKMLIGVIILCDTLLVFITTDTVENFQSNMLFYTLFIVIELGILSYLLYKQYRLKKSEHQIAFKIIGFIAYIVNIFFLVTNLINNYSGLNGAVLGYLVITLLLMLFMSSGYFKYWNNPNFKWFSKNSDIRQDQSIYILYCATTILYFIGLVGIAGVVTWYDQMSMIIAVLGIALIQSANLLKFKKAIKIVGIWIGIKYWILTWVILGVSFDMTFDSAIYSLTGLILALVSIAIGFKLNVKSLRLYGLILTILMVLKFIVVDLSQENSITRVVALLFGGFICFGISVLYNRLNTIISENKLF